MPYVIRRVGKGYKVCKGEKEAKEAKWFSKKPLTKETATKQRIAIIISERSRAAANKNVPKK